MSRIKEITVSLDMTMQPRQYQSVKLGLTVTRQLDDKEGEEVVEGFNLGEEIQSLREYLGVQLREGIRAEIETVYGKATADYVVNQKGV